MVLEKSLKNGCNFLHEPCSTAQVVEMSLSLQQSYSEEHSLGHHLPMVAHIDRFLDLFFKLTIIFQKVQVGDFYFLQVFN